MNNNKSNIEIPDFPERLTFKAHPDSNSSEQLLQQLSANLENCQGKFHQQSALKKNWPILLSFIISIGLMLMMSPLKFVNKWQSIALFLAASSAIIALYSVLLAPSKPGKAEKISRFTIVLATVALMIESYFAWSFSLTKVDMGLKCLSVTMIASMPSLLLLSFSLWRSGLPVRPLHSAAISISAIALSGITVWLHCDIYRFWHMFFGHILFPTLAVIFVSLVNYHFFAFLKQKQY